MKYTVIIPTMWMQRKLLFKMLPVYQAHPSVEEILIINNASSFFAVKAQTFSKVRILNDGNNIFVNPAWNLGVREAKCERVIIANDDIHFLNLNAVLKLADVNLVPGMVMGFHRDSFKKCKNGRVWDDIKVVRPEREYHTYGFGVFMIVHRESWHVVPDNMVVWAGDSLQFNILDPHLIEGVDVDTPMRGTSRRVTEVRKYRQSDIINFNEYMAQL